MSGLRIVADQNMRGVEAAFGPLGDIEFHDGRRLVGADIASADVLLVRSVTEVNRDLLHASPVRFVGSATSGTDHIDHNYLRQQKIAFAHAPGANANAVVEYVLSAIASVGCTLEHVMGGGRVGVVGFGNVGSLLCSTLSAMGIDHLVYDPWLDAAALPEPATLEQVLACDVICLHAELTRQQPWPSYHLVNSQSLACIRPDAVLINACRGAVVHGAALLQHLGDSAAPSVVLDVWEGEPAISSQLLEKVTLGTPHIAGYSLDSKLLATWMLAAALTSEFDLEPAQQGMTGPDLPILVPPAALGGAELLRWLLLQRCDIRVDDKQLRRATLGLSGAEAASGFDRLRRQYRERRELRGSEVSMEECDDADLAVLRALGCQVHVARGRDS